MGRKWAYLSKGSELKWSQIEPGEPTGGFDESPLLVTSHFTNKSVRSRPTTGEAQISRQVSQMGSNRHKSPL